MGRCLHLDKHGRPCTCEAEPDADLCAVHGNPLPARQPLTAAVVRKIIFRLAAAILLLTFLVQGYLFLKAVLGMD